MENSHKNKTVVDAVFALKGDVSNIYRENDRAKNIVLVTDKDDKYITSTEFYKSSLKSSCYFLSSTRPEALISGLLFVCTVGEFNQCVAEMSEGIFVPDCRKKSPEIQYDKDDNGWEVGSMYEFSDDRIKWFSGTFSEYSPNNKRKYVDDTGSHWEFIRECKALLGKIHKKPIELVDGSAYRFEYIAGKFIGIYGKSDDLFYMSNHRTLNREHAKNIIKLVPESV